MLLLLCTAAFAQHKGLPAIPYNTYNNEVADYYDELRVTDKSALIMTAGSHGTYTNTTRKFIVYYSNGKVKKYQQAQDNTVTEIPVTTDEAVALRDFLFTNDWNAIDANKLREPKNKTVVVLDGSSDYFTIYQGSKELSLYSRNTSSHIERRLEGWEHRVKLLGLIARFKTFFD